MKILIIFAHPEQKSFNGAMFHTAIETLRRSGHQVKTSDLYEMNFNPVSDRHNFTTVLDHSFLKLGREEIHATKHDGFTTVIADEQDKLEWCDLLIWQFPLWWFSVPAILKGWVDRVFASGKIYGGGRVPFVSGKFTGKKVLLSVTTGSPATHYLPTGDYGDIQGVLRHVHRGMLEYVGFSLLAPQINYGVAHLNDNQRKDLLDNWSARLEDIFHEEQITGGRF